MKDSDGIPLIPVIWITGMPSSGKSTLAILLHRILSGSTVRSEILDGDALRRSLSPDLGFKAQDRLEHSRRVTLLCRRLRSIRILPIVALISPYEQARLDARKALGAGFVEVFLDCPLDVCIQRDRKGFYARAMRGEIPEFTGIGAPYEPPRSPEVILRTDLETPEESTLRIMDYLHRMDYCPP